MSDIIELMEQRRLKTIKEQLNKELEYINYQIQLLEDQKRLIQSYIDNPPTTEKELDWHEKPPLSSDEISSLYEKYMKHSYNPDDYTDKDKE
jgi:hypothetical protein